MQLYRLGLPALHKWLLVAILLACSLTAVLPSPARAQGHAGAHHLFLVPRDPTGIQVLAHVAEIRIDQSFGYETIRTVVASYQLHNKQAEPTELTLHIQPASESPAEALALTGPPVLRRDGSLWPLVQVADNPTSAVMVLAPDERVELELSYELTGSTSIFPSVAYPIEPLRRWSTPPDSTRISIFTDFAPSPRNLQVLWPQGHEEHPNEIRWHWENALPWQGPAIRFIHRVAWDGIRAAEAAGDWIALGQGFHALYSASDESGDQRRLYYDQALAAFLEAMAERPTEAHYELARLYRTRITGSGGQADSHYLDLALDHARTAMALLPGERTVERQELIRWIEEGLTTKVRQATLNGNWPTVDKALAALEELPDEFANPDRVARLEAETATEQALQLLGAGAVAEAVAVEGESILDPSLLPDSRLIPLFSGWRVDVVASTQRLAIDLIAWTEVSQRSRLDTELAGLRRLVASVGNDASLDWSTTRDPESVHPQTDRLELNLTVRDSDAATRMADRMAPDSEWLLLRQILRTSWPSKIRNTGLVASQVRWDYTLDLTEVYSFWEAKAVSLDNRLVELASAGTSDTADKIRQGHLANTAAAWRSLADNTLILVSLDDGSGIFTDDTVWLGSRLDPFIQATRIRRSPDPLRLGLVLIWTTAAVSFAAVGMGRLLTSAPASEKQEQAAA
ncbi:MAG: hypothetical protein F4Y08_04000 [Caldilineaceae bacterium SB0662_bin_9]|uniref:Uncharacterized protein n=1 Tax=Caldilineaceae bacterium SB0662_bin_9 TaxID=2605258 RepID=A0A6B1DQR2_9CHLR|nr:hypothetical protein [Caldilineaceae bacterium]MYD89491.1 hypothetical protein [Caldilineaceae bacterium SB0662_bin_9]